MQIKFVDILKENVLTEALKIRKFKAPDHINDFNVLLAQLKRNKINYVVLDAYTSMQTVIDIISFSNKNKTDVFYYNDEWKNIIVSTNKI